MRYECTIRAYDCFDNINIQAVVREGNGSAEYPWEERVLISNWILGRGESDPVRWLQDVLRACLDVT